MIFSWSEVATLCVIVFVSMIAAVFISRSWWFKKFKLSLEKPTILTMAVSNPKAVEDICRTIPKLTIIERELLLARLFGKTISINKQVSPSGQSWITIAGIMNDDYEAPETPNEATG